MNVTLVIGKHGTGKTHLLHKMTSRVGQVIQGQGFRYLPPGDGPTAIDDAHNCMDAFSNDLASAIRNGHEIILAFPSITLVPKFIRDADPHTITLDQPVLP